MNFLKTKYSDLRQYVRKTEISDRFVTKLAVNLLVLYATFFIYFSVAKFHLNFDLGIFFALAIYGLSGVIITEFFEKEDKKFEIAKVSLFIVIIFSIAFIIDSCGLVKYPTNTQGLSAFYLVGSSLTAEFLIFLFH